MPGGFFISWSLYFYSRFNISKTLTLFFNQFKYKQNKKATNRINTKFVAYDSNENRTRDSTLRGSRLNRLTMEPDLYSRWSVATTSIYYTYYFCNVKNFFKLNFLFSNNPKSFLHIHRFQGFLRPDIIHIHWTCPIFHLCNIYEIHNVLNLLFLFLF